VAVAQIIASFDHACHHAGCPVGRRIDKHTVVFDFKYDGGGIGKGGAGTISVDGKQVAQGRIDRTTPLRFSIDETFDVGEDTGTPVNLDYDVPFKFTGNIEKVVVSLGETKLGAADRKKLHDVRAKLAVD